jgi:hypothetical protein
MEVYSYGLLVVLDAPEVDVSLRGQDTYTLIAEVVLDVIEDIRPGETPWLVSPTGERVSTRLIENTNQRYETLAVEAANWRIVLPLVKGDCPIEMQWPMNVTPRAFAH